MLLVRVCGEAAKEMSVLGEGEYQSRRSLDAGCPNCAACPTRALVLKHGSIAVMAAGACKAATQPGIAREPAAEHSKLNPLVRHTFCGRFDPPSGHSTLQPAVCQRGPAGGDGDRDVPSATLADTAGLSPLQSSFG